MSEELDEESKEKSATMNADGEIMTLKGVTSG